MRKALALLLVLAPPGSAQVRSATPLDLNLAPVPALGLGATPGMASVPGLDLELGLELDLDLNLMPETGAALVFETRSVKPLAASAMMPESDPAATIQRLGALAAERFALPALARDGAAWLDAAAAAMREDGGLSLEAALVAVVQADTDLTPEQSAKAQRFFKSGLVQERQVFHWDDMTSMRGGSLWHHRRGPHPRPVDTPGWENDFTQVIPEVKVDLDAELGRGWREAVLGALGERILAAREESLEKAQERKKIDLKDRRGRSLFKSVSVPEPGFEERLSAQAARRLGVAVEAGWLARAAALARNDPALDLEAALAAAAGGDGAAFEEWLRTGLARAGVPGMATGMWSLGGHLYAALRQPGGGEDLFVKTGAGWERLVRHIGFPREIHGRLYFSSYNTRKSYVVEGGKARVIADAMGMGWAQSFEGRAYLMTHDALVEVRRDGSMRAVPGLPEPRGGRFVRNGDALYLFTPKNVYRKDAAGWTRVFEGEGWSGGGPRDPVVHDGKVFFVAGAFEIGMLEGDGWKPIAPKMSSNYGTLFEADGALYTSQMHRLLRWDGGAFVELSDPDPTKSLMGMKEWRGKVYVSKGRQYRLGADGFTELPEHFYMRHSFERAGRLYAGTWRGLFEVRSDDEWVQVLPEVQTESMVEHAGMTYLGIHDGETRSWEPLAESLGASWRADLERAFAAELAAARARGEGRAGRPAAGPVTDGRGRTIFNGIRRLLFP